MGLRRVDCGGAGRESKKTVSATAPILPEAVAKAADLWLIGPRAVPPLPERLLQKNMPQIVVDGGNVSAPMLWLGDGDSGFPPADVPAILKPTQDMTDFEFALDVLRDAAWRRLHLSGFTGGRADHALAVLGVIHAEMRRRASFEQAVFYDDAGDVTQRFFAAGAQSFRHEGGFSVFTLDAAVLGLSGACAYPAHRLPLPPLAGRGVSNSASGEVRIECDAPVLVMLSKI